ncbi:MAG: YdcF family protein [Verrucomicrobiota bacterium]
MRVSSEMFSFLKRHPHYLAWLGICFLLTLLICFSGSWLIARKVGALILMPVGLLWIIGLFGLLVPGIRPRTRLGLLLIWTFFSLAGSPYLGASLLRQLEKPYYNAEELQTALDVLVLLGGGTASTPEGNPALGTHGDRVLRPAVLFREGKVGTLIATGRSITEKGKDRVLSEETSRIWQSMGVPESSIIQLPNPRNTAEELAEVAEILSRHPEWKRVGICSSASHLRRAMKQAEKQGLDLIPVPSDFRSGPLPFSPLYLIPQGRGFRDVQSALWEYLGALF